MAYCGCMDRQSSLYSLTLQLLQGFFWSLCCLCDWCPACLVWEFWWVCLFWQVCCHTMFFLFDENEFDDTPVNHQRSRFFLISQPWFAFLNNFDMFWFVVLLGVHGVVWLVLVLQPLGLYMLTDIGIPRLHTDGLYFTKHVTNQGNWFDLNFLEAL